MSRPGAEIPGELSLLDLFRTEVESQTALLTEGILALERGADAAERTREMMRAAHSLKGAARIVGREAAVRLAHAIEDCMAGVQKKKRGLSQPLIDRLLRTVDMLNVIAHVAEEDFETWQHAQQLAIESLIDRLSLAATSLPGEAAFAAPAPAKVPDPPAVPEPAAGSALRVTAGNLNRLMAVAGETAVATRWLESHLGRMLRLKKLQREMIRQWEDIRHRLPPTAVSDELSRKLFRLREHENECQAFLADRIDELELFDRRMSGIARRLSDEVLDCRMRPFADGTGGFPRMVRDLANSLGKSVKFEIAGESTLVDREILEKLKPPLIHLLRNALDHGIELPADRVRASKPEEASLRLEARHSAGMLLVTVSDDGSGIDVEAIRSAVVRRKISPPEIGGKLSEAELLEFLFLPGFSLRDTVSEISGRGVGLDVVRTMAREVGGHIHIASSRGQGTRFQFDLPLTLSISRALLVEISGEPYGIPLARIERVLKVSRKSIESIEGRQYFTLDSEPVGLVAAWQVLELAPPLASNADVPVVVLGENTSRYALVVDRFLGEIELAIVPLDPRLGKIRDISSAAQMPDGNPVLIVDVDDLNSSIASLASGQRLSGVGASTEKQTKRKQILVAEDSLTVRELERKLLESGGYAVDVAVDGMDAWNALRTGNYDLVMTDVDMPRMDGIELVKLIRKDGRLKSLPVMIVSYKDRQEDRDRGLEAGADYYLTKASFQDKALPGIVADLIGAPES